MVTNHVEEGIYIYIYISREELTQWRKVSTGEKRGNRFKIDFRLRIKVVSR